MDFNPQKRLGFGCMRLKMTNDEVDREECNRMIDRFMAAGFTYFDTAHGYLSGKSEAALRPCLTERAVRGITDPHAALEQIRLTLAALEKPN